MDTTSLLAHMNQLVRLTEEEETYLQSILISRPFKQGEIIVRSGDTARYMMFVNTGYLMSYYTDNEGTEHVTMFSRNGWWSGDLYSLSDDPTTIYTTKALHEGELLLLPRSAHDQLFEKYPKFERYFRMYFHSAIIRNQLRLVESHSADAEQRYLKFITTFPGMEQYVPQKYIASYLGITPEFLSRVRKRMQTVKS
jgi:CRP-like cAMP-binding protein